MPPADCTHLVQRRNISHFLIRTVCLSGYIRQKDDFIDCWYSNILACLLYVTYVRLGHVRVYVHMCEEMFVSKKVTILQYFTVSVLYLLRSIRFSSKSKTAFLFLW